MMTNTAAAVAEGKGLNSSSGAIASQKKLIIVMCDMSGEEMIQTKCPRSLSGNRKGGGEDFLLLHLHFANQP